MALGYKNIKTNTFSARLSAARQFGLLVLKDEGYSLTTLAKSILHPVDPDDVPRLYRQALLEPPLYHDLAEQFVDKRVPEANILGNVLYHNYQIIASAKQAAAEAFLDSARFAGAMGDDHILRPGGVRAARGPAPTPGRLATASPASRRCRPRGLGPGQAEPGDVRIDLRLWDADQGKAIRVRAPEVITPASFDRLIQTFRLHLRIEEPEPDRAPAEPKTRRPSAEDPTASERPGVGGADQAVVPPLRPAQMNSLIRFSSISCRPLTLVVTSPLGRMYASRSLKLDSPASIRRPSSPSQLL